MRAKCGANARAERSAEPRTVSVAFGSANARSLQCALGCAIQIAERLANSVTFLHANSFANYCTCASFSD